jgi:hypothetical protein
MAPSGLRGLATGYWASCRDGTAELTVGILSVAVLFAVFVVPGRQGALVDVRRQRHKEQIQSRFIQRCCGIAAGAIALRNHDEALGLLGLRST